MTAVTGRRAGVLGSRAGTVRYAAALGLALLGLAVAEVLLPATTTVTYTPLLGAVALSVWFGGLGPGLLACILSWSAALLVLTEPRFRFDHDRDDALRWSASLLVALVITWVAWAMRRRRERAAAAADEAEQGRAQVERLQAVASTLAVAASPEEVARAIIEGASSALGASGAAMGLIEGGELRLVDPIGSAREAQVERGVIPLAARALITTAAREGRLCWAADRDQLAREYPDSTRLMPTTQSLITAPLFMRGSVVGSVGFAFDEPGQATEDNRSFVRLVAELGGSALERASLYANERDLREKLERILAVAPHFGAGGTAVTVAVEVCKGAIEAFEADVAQIWSAGNEEGFEVVWREPPHDSVLPGTRLDADDSPGLPQALNELRAMFVADLQENARGLVLRHAREAGIRSALRIPIVIGARAQRVLVLNWHHVIPEPDAGFVALARRFADQAGLAIEQAERRKAQREASRRADETRRLLDVTAALAAAATVDDVAAAILEQASHSLGAVAGLVARRLEHEPKLEVVRAVGFDPDALERWPGLSLDADTPLPVAVRQNETIVISPLDELDPSHAALDSGSARDGHRSLLSIPLSVGGQPIGGLALEFSDSRSFTAPDLEFIGALARQAGQAFERARLLDAEQRARARAERIAAGLAQLHALGMTLSRAQSPEEIAAAVGRQMVGVLDARSAGVYVVDASGSRLELLGSAGDDRIDLDEIQVVQLDARAPAAEAVRADAPVWVEEEDEWERFPDGAGWLRQGVASFGVAPMVVDEGPVGALYVAFPPGRTIDAEERRFVETIGRQVAQPLDRVRLLAAERSARLIAEQATERTRRLQRVTEALASASTIADVGGVAVREGVAVAAADAARIYVAGDGVLELVDSTGYPAEVLERARQIDRDASEPVSDVVRSGQLLAMESTDEIVTHYPHLEGIVERAGDRAFICAPLVAGGEVLGALYVASRTARRFDAGERLVALTLARQCAQALARARGYEAERAATERVRRLQEVTASLSQAPTPEAVGATCLELAADAVGARAGVVAWLTSDGALRPVAAIGYDGHAWDVLLESDTPLAEVVRTGQPVWALTPPVSGRYGDVTAARAAGDTAWAAIPLSGRGGALGALLLGFAEAPSLVVEDRDWLVALAGQCSQALDRSRLYDDERSTRRRSERLQALTAALSGALTADEVASVFLEQSPAALEADGAAIALADEKGEFLEPLVWSGLKDETAHGWPSLPGEERDPIAEAFRHGQTATFASRMELVAAYPRLDEAAVEHDVQAVTISPLKAGERKLGVVVLTWQTERQLSADEHAFVATVSSQCAQSLDRARRYETERTIAETLQRSVLPEKLPDAEGLELAARYLAGTTGVDVGGDWFDTIELKGGRVAMVVGDVVGKGVQAAATMGQLRNALRAFAFEQLRPALAVTRLNRLVDTLGDAPFATLAYVIVDPHSRVCVYTLAGHPPPLVRSSDGRADFLSGGRSLPLGIGGDVSFQQATVELQSGDSLFLYTDGLVERRDVPLEDGLERLRAAVSSGPAEPEALVEHVLARLVEGAERNDDTVVLAARLVPVGAMSLVLPAAREALPTVRKELRSWLARVGATEKDAEDIVLAAWEACANAVEHADAPTAGDFALEASRKDDWVRILVRDRGRWKPQVDRDDRGLGLRLIRALMESVEVSPDEGGTVVRMERRVGTRKAS